MCLQCLAKAERIGDIAPGFALYRATKDAQGWPKGAYGLVRENDPDLVIAATPVPDPCFGLSDDEIDAQPPSADDAWAAFMATVEAVEAAMPRDAMFGYKLVMGLTQAGYDPEQHCYRVACFLVHRMAQVIADNPEPWPHALGRKLNDASHILSLSPSPDGVGGTFKRVRVRRVIGDARAIAAISYLAAVSQPPDAIQRDQHGVWTMYLSHDDLPAALDEFTAGNDEVEAHAKRQDVVQRFIGESLKVLQVFNDESKLIEFVGSSRAECVRQLREAITANGPAFAVGLSISPDFTSRLRFLAVRGEEGKFGVYHQRSGAEPPALVSEALPFDAILPVFIAAVSDSGRHWR